MEGTEEMLVCKPVWHGDLGLAHKCYLTTIAFDAIYNDLSGAERKVTDLYINQLADGRLMHNNSWIEANGWTTDAYMFSVTYKDGTDSAASKDIFVSNGCALHRGNDTYFSSLSKLFYIQKEEGKNLKLWIEGQPKVNANFGQLRHPSVLQVNGKQMPVCYEHGVLKVKY